MPKVGYRFRPTEQELLGYFLYNKITENPVLNDDEDEPVKVCDLYGDQEPWNIWNFYGGKYLLKDEALYFFTQLKKLSPKASRYNRKIGYGAWQGEDAAKSIEACDSDEVLGFKKRFRYENSNNSEENGGWIMYEYTINPSLLREKYSHNAMDYVLCCIKKNESVQKKVKTALVTKQRKLKRMDEKNESVQGVLGKKRRLNQRGSTPTNGGQNKCAKAEVETILIPPTEVPCANNVSEVVLNEPETERYCHHFDAEDLFYDINPSAEAELSPLIFDIGAEGVESKADKQSNCHYFDVEDLFYNVSTSSEALSSSLTFDIGELLSELDQREEVNSIECPVNVDECLQNQHSRAEEAAAAGQVVDCEAEKNPLLGEEYEGFDSKKMDQVLERVLTNVDMETLEHWTF